VSELCVKTIKIFGGVTMKKAVIGLFCFAVLAFQGCDVVDDGTTGNNANVKESSEIKGVVKQYFDVKYESMSTLKTENAKSVTQSIAPAAGLSDSLKKEIAKREALVKIAVENNNIRYAKYEYTLDYDSITVDSDSTKAEVVLRESHDVNFAAAPDITSSMKDLKHTVTLICESGQWKIVDDNYFDENSTIAPEGSSDITIVDSAETAEAAQRSVQSKAVSYSYHEYNSSAAVGYALQWAMGRNLAMYADFEANGGGGDCTNFVSQCIHAGGAPMDRSGSLLWYYSNTNYAAGGYVSTWTYTPDLHYYLINNYSGRGEGPMGTLTNLGNVTTGDVVQFKNANGVWHHSMIVTEVRYTPTSSGVSRFVYVSGHTTNRRNYALDALTSGETLRYIHITGYMSASSGSSIQVYYRTYDDVRKAWLPTVTDATDYAGIYGHDVDCIQSSLSSGNIYYRVHYKGGSWLPEVKNCTDYAGIYNSPIDGLMMKTDTGKTIHYMVHLRRTNRWLPWVTGYNTGDSNNGYAGTFGQEIDGVQIYLN
jgi:hypothetical protein